MPISTTFVVAFNDDTVSTVARTLADFGFSAAQIDKADRAFITVDLADVRFRYDGTAPTAAIGHSLNAGDMWLMDGNQNIRQLQFIRAGGTDAYVGITLESYTP